MTIKPTTPKIVNKDTKEIKSMTNTNISNDQFAQMMAMMQTMNSKIDSQTAKINSQNSKIDSLTNTVEELKIENNNLKLKVVSLTVDNNSLRRELAKVKGRLDNVEARLDLIDKTLTGLAPVIRGLLSENSLMLDAGYEELRDAEDIKNFTTVSQVAKNDSRVEQILELGHFKNERGLVTSLSQKLSNFYFQVTQYKPRHEGNTYRYWLEAEHILVENVLRVFSECFKIK